MTQITLPLYIQKNIIKIICKHINYSNKLMDIIGTDNDYRDKEKEIKKLMISIALVSKDFFKTLSNNLYVSVDFNYKEETNNNEQSSTISTSWSIIKPENIKVLKLHFDHTDHNVYQMINGELVNIEWETVNEKIQKLSKSNTFKTLNFRNLNSRLTQEETILPTINRLYDCDQTRNKLHFYEIVLKRTTKIEQIISIGKKVKRIFAITIDECVNREIILELFKLYHKKLILLDIYDIISNNFSICELLVTKNFNYLSNLTTINLTDPKITIKETVSLFKSIGNMENFKVNLCYKNLIYFLSTMEERTQDPSIIRCQCDSVVFRGPNIVDEQQEFNENIIQLKELIKNQSKLNYLCLNHQCSSFGGIHIRKDPFPNSFVESVASLVSQSKSLREFCFMSSSTSQLIKEIVRLNKTIIHYDISAIDSACNIPKVLSEFTKIVTENQHIKTFRFTKLTYNVFNNNFDSDKLLNYKQQQQQQ